ncbi:RHS repeat-associated core domain-containing protein [Streptomyces erythrochromogenes]|uniref:RHS repeat-associated core domain-containing protein n=1 Tax=Streptomyces erythrochromogenes TaxID=285574 RepID=UPI0037F6022A
MATHSTWCVTRRKFTPFGEARGTSPSSWPGEKGFVGGTLDESTGLTHLGAREYDPAIGRFISVDPEMNMAESQAMNPYGYANNSPITFSDPTGRSWLGAIGAVLGGALGAALMAVDLALSTYQKYKNQLRGGTAPAPAKPVSTVSAADVERAKQLKAQSKADIALSIAKEVFKGVTGYDDIVACIGGDYVTCGMLAVEQAFGIFGKAKRFAKAMERAVKMFNKWADDIAWATRTLTRADDDAKALAKYNDDLTAWQRRADADAAAARKADEVEAPASAKSDSGGSGGDAGSNGPGASGGGGAKFDAEAEWDRLPKFDGRTTVGTAQNSDGRRIEQMESGHKVRDAKLLQRVRELARPTGKVRGNSIPGQASHTEQKIAAQMDIDGWDHADVVINHPKGPCSADPYFSCSPLLGTLVGPNRTLTVHWRPDGVGEMRSVTFGGGKR